MTRPISNYRVVFKISVFLLSSSSIDYSFSSSSFAFANKPLALVISIISFDLQLRMIDFPSQSSLSTRSLIFFSYLINFILHILSLLPFSWLFFCSSINLYFWLASLTYFTQPSVMTKLDLCLSVWTSIQGDIRSIA